VAAANIGVTVSGMPPNEKFVLQPLLPEVTPHKPGLGALVNMTVPEFGPLEET